MALVYLDHTDLARFFDAGVQVLSTANLHPGLIVTPEKVIVGPASASMSSTVAEETALVADDPEVMPPRTCSSTAHWKLAGRPGCAVGCNRQPRIEHDFLPTPVRRLFLLPTRDYVPTAEDETSWAAPSNLTSPVSTGSFTSGCGTIAV